MTELNIDWSHIDPIVLHEDTRPRTTVEHAPAISAISLELIWQADPRELRVDGNLIHIAGQVTYRVIGWKDTALIVELVEVRSEETQTNENP